MDLDKIRREAAKARQTMECTERIDFLLGVIDNRDFRINELERQHEDDMKLLEQATNPNQPKAKVKVKDVRSQIRKRGVRPNQRARGLKWATIHSMREDYVLNGMTINAIAGKYSVAFDTAKSIVLNQSKSWYLPEYQDVLRDRGLLPNG